MRNVKCTVAYDGTAYCGYQRQSGQTTVQAVLEVAVEKIFGRKTTVYASGRTDSGVHALGQVIHFHTESIIPEEKIAAALNSVLPPDIVILNACIVDDSFHARINAFSKTYMYQILNRKNACPFRRYFSLHLPMEIDVEAMNQAAELLLGTHDFASFQAAGSSVKNSVRTITHSCVHRDDDMVIYTVTANGFLYNMVRVIVGTLIEVGKGKLCPDDVGYILRATCRSKAGPTAPSQGLFLKEVEYAPKGLDLT